MTIPVQTMLVIRDRFLSEWPDIRPANLADAQEWCAAHSRDARAPFTVWRRTITDIPVPADANPSALDPAIVTDLALTLLGRPRAGTTHVECPGCDRLVHHSDRSHHARVCAELRAIATPPSLAPRTP